MNHIAILPVAWLLLAGPVVTPQNSSQIHPEKRAFQDEQQWSATGPGDVKLKNFRPFRAVYERHYIVGAGPTRGQPRVDRVIVTAESVGWDGRKAVLITLIDTGDAKWDDTTARSLFSIVDASDMSLLFESGPIPGKAKDYYFIRPGEGMGTMVMTHDASVQKREFPKGARGFGPGPWVLGSMALKPGQKVRLDPFVAPPGSILGIRSGIVKGKREFTDLSGRKHSGWLLERGGNLKSSRMGQLYVTNSPPYFLGRFSVDLKTKKETRGFRLIEFRLLD